METISPTNVLTATYPANRLTIQLANQPVRALISDLINGLRKDFFRFAHLQQPSPSALLRSGLLSISDAYASITLW